MRVTDFRKVNTPQPVMMVFGYHGDMFERIETSTQQGPSEIKLILQGNL